MNQRLEDDIQLLQTQNKQLIGRQHETEKRLGHTEFEVQLMKNLVKGKENSGNHSGKEDSEVLQRAKSDLAKLRGMIGKVSGLGSRLASYCPCYLDHCSIFEGKNPMILSVNFGGFL